MRPLVLWSTLLLVSGTALADPVQDVIDSNQPKMSACYEKLRKKEPNAVGTVEVSWHINAGGKSSKVKVVSGSLKDAKFHQCLKDQISGWTFPNGVGPAEKVVSYTFGPPL